MTLRRFHALEKGPPDTYFLFDFDGLHCVPSPNFCRAGRGGAFPILFHRSAICVRVDRGKPFMKIRYSERVVTEFPVIFAGDSFVGEGTVNNVSVPGCGILSNKSVEPGTYLEMKVLLPDNAPSLCVELARIRW